MRLTLSYTLVFGAVFALGTTVARAGCADLSYQRNAIYAAAGYCFKTAAQIRNFGNAGCQYDNEADVPLSRGARARIAAIVQEEEYRGCR